MAAAEKKWLFTLFSAAFISLLFLLSAISGFNAYSAFSFHRPFPSSVRYGATYPPAFAYYISGGRGHKDRILRLLLAVYHPRNRYLLHLGTDASNEERQQLAVAVRAVPVIRTFGNVDVVGKPDSLTYMGSSNIAAALHAAAILLKVDSGWDWFITLSSVDYPLLTQDDLLHVFSTVRRDLNFIDHTSDLGWKDSCFIRYQRVQPIVVDPGLYLARRGNQIFHASGKRPTPEAFKFFTGSPWVMLSRPFLEFCVLGWDNLPRTLLMYFTNSGAAFARQFHQDDPVLDIVDEKILMRGPKHPAPGAWCTGKGSWWTDPCSKLGDVNVVRPGPQAVKFAEAMTNHLNEWNSHLNQCK
uniref:Beta-glucuronosyltransferase GlcAT14A-like n=1 Tax=Nelumbo nucifera TaxID=4432 RepID=A0A822YHC3_NELNU|nr:TPA_asm: hypothetical protein HUJ06_010841 [Nelumbo nucifera]